MYIFILEMEQPFSHLEQNTILWEQARGQVDLNSSILCAALGVHPYKTRACLYREIIDKIPVQIPAFLSDWGHKHEPEIRYRVSQYLGLPIETTGLWMREYNGILVGSSPDGLIGNDSTLEIKASAPNRSEREPVQSILIHDIPQVLMQLFTTGRKIGYYARWNGSTKISLIKLPSDDGLSEFLLDEFKRYKIEYLDQKKKPPPMKRKDKGQILEKLLQFASKGHLIATIDYIPDVPH